MKSAYIIIALLSGLLFLCCNKSDDQDINHQTIEIQNAVSLENKMNYLVGDTIFIDVAFSRYLVGNDPANLTDIYEKTGAEDFSFRLDLNKFSKLSNRFQRIWVVREFLHAKKGSIADDNVAYAHINDDKSQYEASIGVLLVETGQFKIDFDFFTMRSEKKNTSPDDFQITLNHSFEGDYPNFEFLVTE